MNLEEMKRRLMEVEAISFSTHFLQRRAIRGISEEEIRQNLAAPTRLMHLEAQTGEAEVEKYALLFARSGQYDLKVVISIKNKRLNVVTAHIQNVKRRRRYEKWLRQKRR